jgi:hypothetical protein
MSKNVISFSFNWNNKLQNKAFSTIRIHNPKKYQVGNVYKIELKGEAIGTAILQEKRTLKADQLNNFICFLDTGYNRPDTLNILSKMYKIENLPNIYFDFCLLVYQKPEKLKTKELELNLIGLE